MFLYIDPGTGSMLFSILIGVISTLVFFGRQLFLKLKFILSGGKAEKISNSKIPYVIFSDHKRYWNVFKPVCDEFEKRGIDLVYWTASPDDPVLSEKYEHIKAEFIGAGNKAFARLNMMNAGICLSTTPGLDVYQWKRSKNVDYYVHVFHEVGEPVTYRMFGIDYYDAALLSGDFQKDYIHAIEGQRNINKKELVTVGCTYLDSMKKRLSENQKPEANKNPVILLAPSWGETSILSRFGSKIIDSLLQTGFTLVVRPHPQTVVSEKHILEPLQKAYPDSDKIQWNFDNDNFDILNKADVLITDFSGIIFDFSLVFDKPVVIADTHYNTAPYDAAWIDDQLWRFKVLPELGIPLQEKDFPNLKAILSDLLSNEKYQAGRDRVRQEAWQHQGNAAKNIVDYLVEKSNQL